MNPAKKPIPIPTIKIVDSNTKKGYRIINESDFDPKTMKKWKKLVQKKITETVKKSSKGTKTKKAKE